MALGRNIYSAHRLSQYRLLSLILTSSYKYCCAEHREAKKRAAELERPAEEAMAKTVKNTEEAAETAPNAEEAEQTAAITAKEACPKAEEQKASVKSVK